MRPRRIWRHLLLIGALALLLTAIPLGTAGANGGTNGVYELYAGQDILVGELIVSNDTENLTVTFKMTGDYCMTGTHLQVEAELDDVPQTKKGNPIPGQFEYSEDHDCVYSYTYPPIPLDGLAAGDDVIIAAHADVKAPVDGDMCQVWQIGDVEAPVEYPDGNDYLSNYADEFNWPDATATTAGPGLAVVEPAFDDPFIVGFSDTEDFPYNSNANRGYADDFKVQWDGHLHFGGMLSVSWSPGQSAAEMKAISPGATPSTFSHTGAPTPGEGYFLDRYPLFEDQAELAPLGTDTHQIRFEHTKGDGTFWDWVRLERPCETDESAWSAGNDFSGKNWATYSTYEVQPVLIETVNVLSRNAAGTSNEVVSSVATLTNGDKYRLDASGTYRFANSATWGIADAQCSLRPNGTWQNGDVYTPTYPAYLEVMVDNGQFAWSPDTCDASHEYSGEVTGDGTTIQFTIRDACSLGSDGCYSDNSGFIPVDIYWLG